MISASLPSFALLALMPFKRSAVWTSIDYHSDFGAASLVSNRRLIRTILPLPALFDAVAL